MIQVMQIEYKVFPYPKGDSIPYDIGNSIPAVQVQDETMKRNKEKNSQLTFEELIVEM